MSLQTKRSQVEMQEQVGNVKHLNNFLLDHETYDKTLSYHKHVIAISHDKEIYIKKEIIILLDNKILLNGTSFNI